MRKYFVASCSYGKDSLAMILKIKEFNMPLDEVVFCEIMFDEETSGLHPKQIAFINMARTKLENMGIKVTHLRGITYKEQFYKVKQRGKYKDTIYGFPMTIRGKGWCTDRLKVGVINSYLKRLKQEYDLYQYVGIAYDEQERISNNPKIIYPLVNLKITEEQAKKICIDNNLLSPLYGSQNRDGCWFCHKQRISNLRKIRKDYPELWNKLLEIDKDSPVIFKNKYSVHQLEKRFSIAIEQANIFDYLREEKEKYE